MTNHLAAIRIAANVLREQVGYAIEETGGWRIDNIRVFSDQVLRLLDAAEKETARAKCFLRTLVIPIAASVEAAKFTHATPIIAPAAGGGS